MFLYHKDGIKADIRNCMFLLSDPYCNSVEQNWLSFKAAIQEGIVKHISQRVNKLSIKTCPLVKPLHQTYDEG